MAVVSLLAQVADLKASQAAGAASSVMPSGVILPYGGATAPAGWLECNGQAVSQTDYADLFAALGSAYNTQLNPTTGANWAAPSADQFRVPDMRGMFLRGEGTPSGLDAVSVGGTQVDKTKKNGLSATSAAIGFTGTSAGSNGVNLSHEHSINSVAGRIWVDYSNAGGAGYHRLQTTGGYYYNVSNPYYAEGNLGTHSHSTTATGSVSTPAITVANGDNETRPINRGVKYIIKV